MFVMLRRAAAALATVAIVATAAVSATVTPAGAATVAEDYDTAVRDIVFPVVGEVTYSDTFGACRSGCSRGHEGTDIMAPKLAHAVAARSGEVVWMKATAKPDGSGGNYLMLRDADGWEYWYIHLNNDSPDTDDGANPPEWIFAPGIEMGARVEAGQHVAYVGDSGNAENSGSHLHFEIHKPDGSVINPYRSLKAATASANASDGEPPTGDRRSGADADFAAALAEDFLDRPATDAEVASVVDRMAAGTSREAIVAEYASSDEWVSVLVTRYYRSTLGREPDPAGLRHWVRTIQGGMTPARAAAEFYASTEYFTRSGSTNDGWVRDLYDEILLRAPDQGGLEAWVGAARSGVSRPTIARDFYGSLESRRTRVAGLYADLLGRSPDPGGHAAWAERLQNGRDIELATLLASSEEYQRRAVDRAG